MRSLLISIFFCLMLGAVSAQQPFKLMTYNIRYNNLGDEVNAWPNRKEVKYLVEFYDTNILCVHVSGPFY